MRESHSEYCFVIHPYGFMDQSFIILYYLVVFHMNMLSFALHSLIDGHLVGFQILVIINKQCKHCDTYLFGNISFLEKKKGKYLKSGLLSHQEDIVSISPDIWVFSFYDANA